MKIRFLITGCIVLAIFAVFQNCDHESNSNKTYQVQTLSNFTFSHNGIYDGILKFSGTCKADVGITITGNIPTSPTNIPCARGVFEVQLDLGERGQKILNLTQVGSPPYVFKIINTVIPLTLNEGDLCQAPYQISEEGCHIPPVPPLPPSPTTPQEIANLNATQYGIYDNLLELTGICKTDIDIVISGNFPKPPLGAICNEGTFTASLELGDRGEKVLSLIQEGSPPFALHVINTLIPEGLNEGDLCQSPYQVTKDGCHHIPPVNSGELCQFTHPNLFFSKRISPPLIGEEGFSFVARTPYSNFIKEITDVSISTIETIKFSIYVDDEHNIIRILNTIYAGDLNSLTSKGQYDFTGLISLLPEGKGIESIHYFGGKSFQLRIFSIKSKTQMDFSIIYDGSEVLFGKISCCPRTQAWNFYTCG